jgi:signal recognition particle receptor subunit beta
MVSGLRDEDSPASAVPTSLKVVVAGGLGAGKSTLVGSVSEITPLHTEEVYTRRDPRTGASRSSTVTMDFGWLTFDTDLVLYLFSAPGQDGLWQLWDEVALGALGAIVLVDTDRLADCFAAIDYFEQRGTPFLIAINPFFGRQRFDLGTVRAALAVRPHVPVVQCDIRDPRAGRELLVTLIEHVRVRTLAEAAA